MNQDSSNNIWEADISLNIINDISFNNTDISMNNIDISNNILQQQQNFIEALDVNYNNDVSNNTDISNNESYYTGNNATVQINSLEHFLDTLMQNSFPVVNINNRRQQIRTRHPLRIRRMISGFPRVNMPVNNFNRYQQRELNDDELEEFINGTFETDGSEIKKITSQQGLSQIKQIKYKSDMEYNSCPICTDEFEEGEIISVLPCGHYFNPESINLWLKESNKCPMCRFELDFIEAPCEEENSNQQDINPEIDLPSSENSEYESESETENNELSHPFGTLQNRIIVPHSYIQTIIDNQIARDEEAMLQQAIMMSINQQNQNIQTNNE